MVTITKIVFILLPDHLASRLIFRPESRTQGILYPIILPALFKKTQLNVVLLLKMLLDG